MFEIEKEFSFEAGHRLEKHDGPCKDPHGHSYVIIISLKAPHLIEEGPKENMLFDFCDLKRIIKPMIDEYFEHKWLNDTLQTRSPSSEFIARWIFEYLAEKIPHLSSVTCCETSATKARYSPSP